LTRKESRAGDRKKRKDAAKEEVKIFDFFRLFSARRHSFDWRALLTPFSNVPAPSLFSRFAPSERTAVASLHALTHAQRAPRPRRERQKKKRTSLFFFFFYASSSPSVSAFYFSCYSFFRSSSSASSSLVPFRPRRDRHTMDQASLLLNKQLKGKEKKEFEETPLTL